MLWFGGFGVYLIVVSTLLLYLIPEKPPLLMAVITGMLFIAYFTFKYPPIKQNNQKSL